MPRKKVGYFTKLDPDLREAMARYKTAVGVPEAQQIDRALRAWLADKPEAWPDAPRRQGPKKAATSSSRRTPR